MATTRSISKVACPSHLTSMDWSNWQYRTLVASRLVQGVYRLEIDRQKKRKGPQSETNLWWEPLHFTLLQTLTDESKPFSSIYGAIFEYNFSYQNIPGSGVPPRYVIAFRGTILKPKTLFSDMKLNFQCYFEKLHHGNRFVHAVDAVSTMVAEHNDASIWLTGHSLGAGIALLAGKTMARIGCFLESYIFNPPILSIPLEILIKSNKVKSVIRISGSLFKAGIASISKDLEAQEDHLSMNVARWIPYLYVNPSDPICSEYIGYFKNKTTMSKIRFGEIESVAAKNPLRSLLVGKQGTSSSPSDLSPDPLRCVPSAYMTINKNKSKHIFAAHKLQQWWGPSFNVESVLYEFSS